MGPQVGSSTLAGALASWSYPILRNRIGEAGLVAGPLHEGRRRVYASSGVAHNRYWIAFEYEPASDEFQPVHSSISYPDTISFLGVGRVTRGSEAQIIVVLDNGQVFVHREKDYTLIKTFDVVPSARAVEIADVDRDGTDELIVTTADGLHVFSGPHEETADLHRRWENRELHASA